jgi:uncharacterized protein YfaS (alpha-2-macroglobulin family)
MRGIQITLFSILLISLLVLSGCGMLYGEKIHEEKKDYSEQVTFKFNLDESQDIHNINSVVGYSKTRTTSIHANYLATLTLPDGTTQKKSFRVSKTGSKKVLSASTEQKLFEITPQQGEYTLEIKETDERYFNGKSITVKVYKKEEK